MGDNNYETNKDILIRMDERQHTIFKKINSIEAKLFGNGKTGLCTIVDRHEQRFKKQDKLFYGFALAIVLLVIEQIINIGG